MGQQSIRRRGPRRFKNGSIKVLAKVREPTDIALYAGNFEELLRLANERARKSFLQWDDTLTEERASAGIVIRSLLHVAHELEGWGVSLSRWILQAASSSRGSALDGSMTGSTMMGHSRELFASCAMALDPSMATIVERARDTGVVTRADVRTAMAQCITHHGLIEQLARRGARVNEYTKFKWSALHFVAAFGAPQLVQPLLALGANMTARNILGQTPLHLAASHGSVSAAAMLAAALPASSRARAAAGLEPIWAEEWLDGRGRSPEDVALSNSGANVAHCAAMLRALQSRKVASAPIESLKSRKWRCEKTRRRRRSVSSRAASKSTRSSGSGWEPEDCASSSATVAKTADHAEGLLQSKTGCDLPILDASELTTQDIVSDWIGLGTPVLVRGTQMPRHWRAGWARDALQERLGNLSLRLEVYPYAEGSASVVMVTPNRTSLREMLEVTGPSSIFRCGGGTAGVDAGTDRDEGEAPSATKSPTSRSKPPKAAKRRDAARLPSVTTEEPPKSVFMALNGWHFVGRNVTPSSTDGRTLRGDIELVGATDKAANAEHRRLLEEWERPPFIEDSSDNSRLLRSRSIQFYVGGAGAGAQHHWHESAWNWLIRGHKRWLLWPPEGAAYAQRHIQLALDGAARAVGEPLTCDQQAGDVLLVPSLWGHATINLAPSIGFATEIAFDRTFDLDGDLDRPRERAATDLAASEATRRAAAAEAIDGAAAEAAGANESGECTTEPASESDDDDVELEKLLEDDF